VGGEGNRESQNQNLSGRRVPENIKRTSSRNKEAGPGFEEQQGGCWEAITDSLERGGVDLDSEYLRSGESLGIRKDWRRKRIIPNQHMVNGPQEILGVNHQRGLSNSFSTFW